MKTITIAFIIALVPIFLFSQTPQGSDKKLFMEYNLGEDTIFLEVTFKTKEHKIKDGSFAAFIVGKSTINGQYKDDQKIGKWLFFNDDMSVVDSADYSVLHNIPQKEYEKVYYKREEGLQCPDFGKYLGEMNVRYPILNKVKSIQGTVSFQFILNTENEVTNIEILKTYNDDMAMEVVYALRNLKFPKSCIFNGNPINYRVTGGIRFNSYDFTSEPEP